MANPFFRDFAIMRINFYADGVSSPFCRGNRGRTRAHERMQHRVPYEGKHPNQTFDEFFVFDASKLVNVTFVLF